MSSGPFSLRCPICGTAAAEAGPMPAWAAFTAFDDCVRPAVPYADAGQAYAAGSQVALTVRHPFATSADRTFRFLAMPADAACNGWAEDMATLDRSAFVSARLVSARLVSSPDDASAAAGIDVAASVTAMVTGIVGLSELAGRPPHPGPAPLPGDRHQTVNRSRWRDWDLVEASSEGDVGWWLLARHGRDDGPVLVAQGDWWPHGDHVVAGPARVGRKAWEDWCAALGQLA